jgi:SAM-dependent methyltransferase
LKKLLAALALSTAAFAAGPVFTPYSDVAKIADARAETAGLAMWDRWVRQQDAVIRARLDQGDLDSMVNLLLFGTSFTNQPRVPLETIAQAAREGILNARVRDLLMSLQAARPNEKILFVRQLLARHGADPDNAEKAGVFILENVSRVLKELQRFAGRAQAAGPSSEFTTRSRLFEDRGVSLDTSLLPDFGMEQTLRDLKDRGLLKAGGVKRSAVIGPGLDFTDWDQGYDFYPQQTIQPFAWYESLLRLGLAAPGNHSITVFDISPRVLDHLRAARIRARKGSGYVIQLPRETERPWLPEVIQFWRTFGGLVGANIAPIPAPVGLETRAVRIRPDVILACEPVDLNIALQRLELPPGEQFDLVVATNVFVYYDAFQQSLALKNIASMLKPGGFLLTNNELPPDPEMPSAGFTRVKYAEREGAGDTFLWYRSRD